MRNWHEVKLEVRILQLHLVICYVILRSEQFCAKFTETKLEVELRKINT